MAERSTSAVRARSLRLKPQLDGLYDSFNVADSALDPIQIVRQYTDPRDLEVVAFIAAGLAFGRVSIVMDSVRRVVGAMGDSPAAFVRAFEPARDRVHFDGFVHRWVRDADIVALLWMLRQMLERSGSLEAFFLETDPGGDDVYGALDAFCTRAMQLDLRGAYGRVPARPGVAAFFPKPSGGSACKRLNLFMRWMVRRDALDLGVWTRVSPSRLIIPLDTHIIRVAQCLKLTAYASPGWAMARDITRALRGLDADDPVRYDFSVCHLGMMNACGNGTPRGNAHCPLKDVCRPKRRAASAVRTREGHD